MTATAAQRLHTIRRIALLCAGLMLLTIVLSAYMRLVQAGLGCADWPACYGPGGLALPQGSSVVSAARLLHRIVASLALVLVITMTLACLATRPALRREGALAAALLVLALALAVLGVVTPGARLPAVTMGNLIGGFAMLALCWRLAAADDAARAAVPRAWSLAALALLVTQIALGALVSGSWSALACDGFADCLRSAQAAGWDLQALNPWRAPAAAPAADRGAGALLQWAHRVGAIVLLPLLAWVGLQAWQRGRRGEGAAVLALVVGQALLGPLMVALGLPLALVLMHNLCAALLFALLVRMA